MRSFIIKSLKKKLVIDDTLDNLEGFRYVPKFRQNELKVKEILIVKKELIDALIEASFDKKYKQILEFYFKILSDSDEGDTNGKLMLALDEVARLRQIIIKKYQKTLSKKMSEKLLKKLKILENELRIKIIDYKMIKEQQMVPEIEKGKRR